MAGGDEVGEVADVVDVVLCGGGSALCGGFGEGGADGGEGGGGVGRGVLQKAIGLAKLFDLRWGEAAALEADFVETVGVVVALDRGQRVRQDVLGDGRASADVGVLADAAELVHGTERADDCVVLDDDVAGERGSVGEDASVADGGVVADVDVGHDEAAGADAGDASAGGCSARDGDVFADGVQVTDLTACRLACVLQILGRDAGHAAPATYVSGDHAFEELVKREDIDFVYTATPWEWHVPVMLAALNAGKHCGSECPIGTTLKDLWALVDASEKARKHCLHLENCCYGETEMLVNRMVHTGVFGEMLHAEAAYLHDLREILFENRDEGLGRRTWHTRANANLYPTPGLGPVAWEA